MPVEKETHPAAPDKRVEVVLAEYNGLRAEMTARTTIQATLVGTGFTAIGLVVGFVISDNGSRLLLLLVPILATVVLLLFSNESFRIIKLGDYIGGRQHAYLIELLRDEDLPSWEAAVKESADSRPGLVASILDAPVDVLLLATSAIAAQQAFGAHPLLRAGLVVLVVLAAFMHLWVGFRGKLFTRLRTKSPAAPSQVKSGSTRGGQSCPSGRRDL